MWWRHSLMLAGVRAEAWTAAAEGREKEVGSA